MIAGQRLVDSTNHCVALFPMPYLYVTQNEHDLYSIDFSGWGPNGKVYNAPVYAPFDGKITYKQSGQNTIVFESTSDVRCADGQLHHVRVMLAHADNQPYSVGDIFRMGDLLYHTGTAPPATGDHYITRSGRSRKRRIVRRGEDHRILEQEIEFRRSVCNCGCDGGKKSGG